MKWKESPNKTNLKKNQKANKNPNNCYHLQTDNGQA